MKADNKSNTTKYDHYRNVPSSLREISPKPKFAMKSPQLTSIIAPDGVSALIPGSFLSKTTRKPKAPEKPKKVVKEKTKKQELHQMMPNPMFYQGQAPEKKDLLDKIGSAIWKFICRQKLKIMYVFIGILAVAGLSYLAFYYIPIQSMINATNKLANSDYSEAAMTEWANAVKNFRYITVPAPLQGATEGEFSSALLAYSNSYEEFNKNNSIQIPAVEIKNASEKQIDIEGSYLDTDDKLLTGVSYLSPAHSFTFEKYMNCNLNIANIQSPNLYFLIARVTESVDETTIKGKASPETAITNINSVLNNIKSAISNQSDTDLKSYVTGTDADQINSLIALDPQLTKISKLKVYGSFKDTPATAASGSLIYVGKADGTVNGTNSVGQLSIYYNTDDKVYLIDGLLSLIPNIGKTTTSSSSNTGTNTALDCTDCWLAPVSKQYSLSSMYAPAVIDTGLNGGGKMTVQAAAAMKELFAGATKSGINARIISAYRSYAEQEQTFNYWTQKEMIANSSLTKAQAQAKANNYSAKPGNSEHQLGTVADLKCASCNDFDNNDANNKALYKFLEEHAYEYGFVISYPNGSQSVTGYVYEPWHIRYIGKDLAKEYFNTGYLNGSHSNYLAQFLLEKNLF